MGHLHYPPTAAQMTHRDVINARPIKSRVPLCYTTMNPGYQSTLIWIDALIRRLMMTSYDNPPFLFSKTASFVKEGWGVHYVHINFEYNKSMQHNTPSYNSYPHLPTFYYPINQ